MLGVLGIGFASIPFINVPIYSSARGILKSSTNRVPLISINPGKVSFLHFTNGQKVVQGDTLLILETIGIDEQLDLDHKKIEKFTLQSKDLHYLISNNPPSFKKIKTAKYQKEYIRYHAVLAEHYTKIRKLKEDFNRNKKLFSKGVIAKVAFEDIKLEYDLAKNALHQFKRQSINSWQADLTEMNTVLEELKNGIRQALGNKASYVIKAPIDGWLISNEGLQVGAFVSTGLVLGEITPNDELIAECYISPKDIALIDQKKEVKLQIDALNYNQWGFAYGKIASISNDVEFIENQPVYRVQTSIKDKTMHLKNGYSGKLGKGMTLNVRFELTERTIFQLLYDKIEDWLHPGYGRDIAQNQ